MGIFEKNWKSNPVRAGWMAATIRPWFLHGQLRPPFFAWEPVDLERCVVVLFLRDLPDMQL